MKKIDGMARKKTENLIIFLLILLNIAGFIYITNKVYFRIDATEGKKYSISKSTVELLKKLEDRLVIEYYYNDKTQEVRQIALITQYVNDMLKEYENAGDGLVYVVSRQLSYDKSEDLALIDELEQAGLKPFRLTEQADTESKSFMGISGALIKYKNKTAVLPAIYSDVGFEYQMDVEIEKLLGQGMNKIGILLSSNTLTLEQHFAYLSQVVKQEYKNVDIIQPNMPIPPEVETLIILGGDKMTDYDIFQIDQFLMNGGKAFIALNGIKVIIQQQYGIFGIPNTNKLNNLLASYGLTVNNDLVGDNNSFRPLRQQREFYIEEYRYPVWPLIKQQNFNRDNLIVENLDSLSLFWPSSITVSEEAGKNAQELFTTTDGAWQQLENYQLNVEPYMPPAQQVPEGKFTLSVFYEGELSSYFTDKPVPPAPGGASQSSGKLDKGKTKIVLVANEEFLTNDYVNNPEFMFLMNSIDILTKDTNLIQIRSKGKFSKPLNLPVNEDDLEKRKGTLFAIIFVIVPLVYFLLAIFMFFYRKNKNAQIQSEFVGLDTEIRKVADE